jgi:hypothetical protein
MVLNFFCGVYIPTDHLMKGERYPDQTCVISSLNILLFIIIFVYYYIYKFIFRNIRAIHDLSMYFLETSVLYTI